MYYLTPVPAPTRPDRRTGLTLPRWCGRRRTTEITSSSNAATTPAQSLAWLVGGTLGVQILGPAGAGRDIARARGNGSRVRLGDPDQLDHSRRRHVGQCPAADAQLRSPPKPCARRPACARHTCASSSRLGMASPRRDSSCACSTSSAIRPPSSRTRSAAGANIALTWVKAPRSRLGHPGRRGRWTMVAPTFRSTGSSRTV